MTTAFCGGIPCFQGQDTDRDLIIEEPEDEEPIEIDYDAPELTYLYQAIEDKAFMAAIDFLESGKPSVRDECRTWITRFEKENPKKIRWSQLPLHAAIVFQAPTKVIELLILNYPKAVRCTDDQSMLPIHLAFRKGSSDAILHALLKEFPESVNAKDGRGRYPLQLASAGDGAKKGEMIAIFEENAKVKARKTLAEEKIGVMEDKLAVTETANAELQNTNEALATEKTAIEDELDAVKEELETLKKTADGLAAAAAAAASSPKSIKSTRSFRTTTPGAAVAKAMSIDNAEKSPHTTAPVAPASASAPARKKRFFKMFKNKKSKAAASAAAATTTAAVVADKVKSKEVTAPTVKSKVVEETAPTVLKTELVTPASSTEADLKAEENPADDGGVEPQPVLVETVAS